MFADLNDYSNLLSQFLRSYTNIILNDNLLIHIFNAIICVSKLPFKQLNLQISDILVKFNNFTNHIFQIFLAVSLVYISYLLYQEYNLLQESIAADEPAVQSVPNQEL